MSKSRNKVIYKDFVHARIREIQASARMQELEGADFIIKTLDLLSAAVKHEVTFPELMEKHPDSCPKE